MLRPKLSHIDFTCQKYTLATCKELSDIFEVLTVSYDHGPPWDLYLTLYPQAPGTSSQSNVAEAQPVVELKFVGITQGVNVLNTSSADHADTELLSLVHAVLTCHS